MNVLDRHYLDHRHQPQILDRTPSQVITKPATKSTAAIKRVKIQGSRPDYSLDQFDQENQQSIDPNEDTKEGQKNYDGSAYDSDHRLTYGSAIGSPLVAGMQAIGRSLIAYSATQKKGGESANRFDKFANYIKSLRGVTPDNPSGSISQRELARQVGVKVASIRGYEEKESDPNRVNAHHMKLLARAGGITETELRSWLNNSRYESVGLEDVLAGIRHIHDIADLVQVIEQATMQIKLLSTTMTFDESEESLESGPPPLPKINEFILNKLSDRQEYLGLTDDEKFYEYCQLLSITRNDIESLREGDEIDLIKLGNFARILNLPIDELINVRDGADENDEADEVDNGDDDGDDDDSSLDSQEGRSPTPTPSGNSSRRSSRSTTSSKAGPKAGQKRSRQTRTKRK